MLLNDVKNLTLDKLFITSSESVNSIYTDKISRAINECLLQISNSIDPVTKEFIYCTADASTFKNKEFIAYPSDFVQILDNDNIQIEDECGIYRYANDIEYLGRTGIYVHKPGKYKIQYEANYPIITKLSKIGEVWKTFENTVEYNKSTPYMVKYYASNPTQIGLDSTVTELYELPDYLGPLVSLYAAYTLLSIDDPIRSATLKNEYEIALARVNTESLDNLRDYHSSRGWY